MFEVLDRQHLGTLLKEHNLTVSGLVDDKSAAELGKFIGAAVYVFGRIQTDKYDEAIENLQKAISLDPKKSMDTEGLIFADKIAVALDHKTGERLSTTREGSRGLFFSNANSWYLWNKCREENTQNRDGHQRIFFPTGWRKP